MKERETTDLVVLLPNIRSVHNVGSMFRTADGAGVSKIYLAGYTPEPVDRFGRFRTDFKKTALGAERTMPWEKVPDAAALLKSLKADGSTILALELSVEAVSYDKLPERLFRSKKICLIVGNEVEGVPPTMLKMTDAVIFIPMRGKKESLNVSVAFGIAVYELARRLRAG
ncbi:MAG TPA: TrmH family RNA methyltransferase [Candidatus Paceibacterota bacterium]|nr:TrmH family RNA methyltransferase [Candidatus Paceibacterota bacterium]